MDYVYYVLCILGIMALCLFALRLPGRHRLRKDRAALSERALRRKARLNRSQRPDKKQQQHIHEVLRNELAKVPTPWGWPGHHEAVPRVNHAFRIEAEEVHGISESLHHFVEKLLREKKTIDSQEYRLRKDACLRALVEDRYGRSVDMAQINYREVKPPLLRDPSQPHDQMDNFASGKTDSIVSGLSKQPSLFEKQLSYQKKTQLNQIRRPWGW